MSIDDYFYFIGFITYHYTYGLGIRIRMCLIHIYYLVVCRLYRDLSYDEVDSSSQGILDVVINYNLIKIFSTNFSIKYLSDLVNCSVLNSYLRYFSTVYIIIISFIIE